MLNVVCPSCGGGQVTALGPGRYRCDSTVTYTEDVLVDDPGARFVWGVQGPKWETMRRERACAHEFFTETQHSGNLCAGTSDGSTCGAYAVGVCQGSNCGWPVCSVHGTYRGSRLLCVRCTSLDDARIAGERAEAAAKRADEAAQHAQAQANGLRWQMTSGGRAELLQALKQLVSIRLERSRQRPAPAQSQELNHLGGFLFPVPGHPSNLGLGQQVSHHRTIRSRTFSNLCCPPGAGSSTAEPHSTSTTS